MRDGQGKILWSMVGLYFFANLWVSSLTWQECREVMPFLKNIPQRESFKTRHVIQYGPLAILSSAALRNSFPKAQFGLVLGGGVMLSSTSGGLAEVVQAFTPTRIPSLKDVGFNFIGALIGNFIYFLWMALKGRLKRSKSVAESS